MRVCCVGGSDNRSLPTTYLHRSQLPPPPIFQPAQPAALLRCLGWSFLLLAVLGLIVGVLVQQRVLWFVMPKVEYEKGGSAFQLSTTGPAGEIGGQEYATDFFMTIGVKVRRQCEDENEQEQEKEKEKEKDPVCVCF